MKRTLCILVLLLLVPLSGAQALEGLTLSRNQPIVKETEKKALAKMALISATATPGATLYDSNCKGCHALEFIQKQKFSLRQISQALDNASNTENPHHDISLGKNKDAATPWTAKDLRDLKKYCSHIYQSVHIDEPKMITVGSSVKFNTGGSKSNVAPSIEGVGIIGPSDLLGGLFDGQVKFAIKPDPPAGTAEDVAQSIRVDTGTVAFNIGGHYTYQFQNALDDNGPIAFDARLAGQLSYQRTSTTDTSTTQNPGGGTTTSLTTDNEFGVISPEIRVGFWLKYLYLGYKYTRNYTFGKQDAVSEALNDTGSQKVVLVMKINSLSGNILEEKKSEGEEEVKNKVNNPFLIECQYTGGKNSFNNGTFTLALTKAFDWNW